MKVTGFQENTEKQDADKHETIAAQELELQKLESIFNGEGTVDDAEKTESTTEEAKESEMAVEPEENDAEKAEVD